MLKIQKTIKEFLLEKSPIPAKELEKIDTIARQTNSTMESVFVEKRYSTRGRAISTFS